MTTHPVLELSHISVEFSARRTFFSPPQVIHAVTDVSMTIHEGETLGLVGESGCGKSTLGKVAAGLLRPTSGHVEVYDEEGRKKTVTGVLPGTVQMVFQDPFSSLNPRLKIGASIEEPLAVMGGLSRSERKRRVLETLSLVGLRPEHADRYPHQFSGGQRQRIVIARALVRRPRLIVCDEPVSALDSSVQAQVLNLLKDIEKSFGVALFFISHDLGVVGYMCSRVAVMYLGRIVERAPVEALFARPAHPYTRALLEAAPGADPNRTKSSPLAGDPPSPFNPPAGCAFHPRCPLATPECARALPPDREVAKAHTVACFHPLA